MGGCCCSCLNPKDESEKLTRDAERDNPLYKKDYGSIKTESEHEGPPKESDSLLKSSSARPKPPDQPVKREAPIPKENLSLEITEEKHKKEEHKEEEHKEEERKEEEHKPEEHKPEKEEVPLPPTSEGAGHVKFAPLPPSSSTPAGSTADEEEKSEKSEKSERSESDTTPLVPDDKETTKEKASKPKKKSKFGVASKVSKTAGKMKRALTKKEKEDITKKYQQKPSNQGSQGFDRGKLERVSSSRMKSKYARERLEKIEKEREDKERLQKQTGGFRDPRKAAAERGQKLGELDDATGEMKNQAAGFAQTTHQLAKAMKK